MISLVTKATEKVTLSPQLQWPQVADTQQCLDPGEPRSRGKPSRLLGMYGEPETLEVGLPTDWDNLRFGVRMRAWRRCYSEQPIKSLDTR